MFEFQLAGVEMSELQMSELQTSISSLVVADFIASSVSIQRLQICPCFVPPSNSYPEKLYI